MLPKPWMCIAVLLYISVINPVMARGQHSVVENVTESHNLDYVSTIDDIPEGECRYVYHVPRPVTRIKYPTPPLLCRTQGVVRLAYLNEYNRTDESK